jgi:hypothetical protein
LFIDSIRIYRVAHCSLFSYHSEVAQTPFIDFIDTPRTRAQAFVENLIFFSTLFALSLHFSIKVLALATIALSAVHAAPATAEGMLSFYLTFKPKLREEKKIKNKSNKCNKH